MKRETQLKESGTGVTLDFNDGQDYKSFEAIQNKLQKSFNAKYVTYSEGFGSYLWIFSIDSVDLTLINDVYGNRITAEKTEHKKILLRLHEEWDLLE